MLDLSAIEYDGVSEDDWRAVLQAMHSGEPALVSESIADYFLEVLPPVAMFAGGFAFAEGAEVPTVFIRTGKRSDPWLVQRGAIGETRAALVRLRDARQAASQPRYLCEWTLSLRQAAAMSGCKEADRLVGCLLTRVEARWIAYADPADAIDLLARALDEDEIVYERDARLRDGELDERVEIFLAGAGVAVLLDAGGTLPAIERLRRCSARRDVRALAVLTTLSPDLYPAGNGQRHMVSRKRLYVIRIGRDWEMERGRPLDADLRGRAG
ncbi:MAG TPA: hypothetical protein VF746_03095 [Longimicrobium sp.]